MTRELLIRSICAQYLNNIPGLQALINCKLEEVLSLDGRYITAASEGGRSTSFQIPANMSPEEIHNLLARALIILQVYNATQIKNWLKTPPSTEMRPRFGRYWWGG